MADETVNLMNERIRQRESQTRRRSDLVDRFSERLSQRESRRPRRFESSDRFREWLRQTHSLRQSDGIYRNRNNLGVRTRPRRQSVLPQTPTSPQITFEFRAEERNTESFELTERNNDVNIENNDLGEKGSEDTGNDDDKASFFDCNICLDLAKDPVVTCCGHLFCWPCVYQWLNVHSAANECPVCKGEVTMKTVTPIYGRGGSPLEPKRDTQGLRIPVRPHAQRVESLRQTIREHSIEELIRRSIEALDEDADNADVTVSDEDLMSLPFDDVNSILGMASGIQSERQTGDMALGIDSNVSISASTSSRRNRSNGFWPSDVEFGILSERYTGDMALEMDSNTSISASTSRRRNRSNGFRLSDVEYGIRSERHTGDMALEIDPNASISASTSRRRNRYNGVRLSDVELGIQSDRPTGDMALEIDSNASIAASNSRRRNRSNEFRLSDVEFGILSERYTGDMALEIDSNASVSASTSRRRNRYNGFRLSDVELGIRSERQTDDMALEIDSNVDISPSTSRRRNRSNGFWLSDVDVDI